MYSLANSSNHESRLSTESIEKVKPNTSSR
ncbi:Uncharacterised protein [Vibrio cholerae]|nr:Uncharacterised protein [Vibrio cholerae]